MDAKERGRRGEEVAAAHYRKQGYAIAACNYRVRGGEIDIVAARDGTLVFAEVKSRTTGGQAAPREAVDVRKQQRLILAAQHYLAEHCEEEPFVRFDVVEVLFSPGREPQLHCIENAFFG